MERKYRTLVLVWVLFILSEICAFLIIYNLIMFDNVMWKKGTPEKEKWRTHSWLMGASMIILTGHGMIIFRLMPRFRTVIVKYIHAIIHTVVIAGFIYAYYAIHNFMYMKERRNKSWFLHAFLGWVTGLVYIIEWILAIFIYLYMYPSQKRRKIFASAHNFVGICVLQLAIATSCTMLYQMDYELAIKEKYSDLAMLSMIIYGALINAIVLNPYLEWPLEGPL